jgi:hypothetical protein
MKRTALILIVLCFASSLYAGGKACEAEAKAKKTVELTGTLVPAAGGGDEAKATFRVANSNQTYTVCERTKSSVLKLANAGHDTLRVKGKVVTCGGHEELMIDEAKKL